MLKINASDVAQRTAAQARRMRSESTARFHATRGWLIGCLTPLLLVSVFAGWARAEQARLAHVFQDKMVLQQSEPVPVWGWADPGATVVVSFAGQRAETAAGEDGAWRVTLEPLPASSQGRALTARLGDEMIELDDVLVGEVWIAAGQSNMNAGGPNIPTGIYPFYESSGTSGGQPAIRSIRFGAGASLEPLADVPAPWRGEQVWKTLPEDPPAKNMNLPEYFARVVRDQLKVPVGIVHVAVSGTNQAAWMARSTLEQFPGEDSFDNYYQQFLATMQAKLAKQTDGRMKSFEQFKQIEQDWRQTQEGRWPGQGLNVDNFPTALYNTRIAPLAPLAIRGVIWHQGEAGPGGPYGERLVAMARQWRDAFGQDFYFIFATLSRNSNYMPPLEPNPEWFYRSGTNSEIRKARRMFGDDDRVAMVEFYDLGDHSVHFLQKAEAGRRMGLAALNLAYGQQELFTGPRMIDARIEGDRAVVRFIEVGNGIRFEPSLTGISGVLVQDADGKHHWGDVQVLGGDTIVVTSSGVKKITGIGYAAASNPHETLFNSAGLPASPFTVDLTNVTWAGHIEHTPLVVQIASKDEKTKVDIAHIRRTGYIFRQRQRGHSNGGITFQALVPAQWHGAEVHVAGEPVEIESTTTIGGHDYVQFQAPPNEWIIVAAPGEAQSFHGINRY